MVLYCYVYIQTDKLAIFKIHDWLESSKIQVKTYVFVDELIFIKDYFYYLDCFTIFYSFVYFMTDNLLILATH